MHVYVLTVLDSYSKLQLQIGEFLGVYSSYEKAEQRMNELCKGWLDDKGLELEDVDVDRETCDGDSGYYDYYIKWKGHSGRTFTKLGFSFLICETTVK